MISWFSIFIGIVMLIGSLGVLFQKSLRNAAILFGIVSLLSVILFVLMKAYDVAITEAAIGSVLTTAIFFWTIKRLEEDGYDQ